jgi:hypothetical protein
VNVVLCCPLLLYLPADVGCAWCVHQRALEMSRAERKAAAEERVLATYAREAFQAAEMERIRIAEKRRQKLEYLEATGNMFF